MELSRDDLFLLMQSYENTIKLNTMLLEQHKQLIEDQNKILTKQIESTTKLGTIFDGIEAIGSALSDSLQEIRERKNDIEQVKDTIQEKMNEHHLENIKLFGNLKMGMNITYIAISSLIVSLLGLSYTVFTKLELLEKISHALGA